MHWSIYLKQTSWNSSCFPISCEGCFLLITLGSFQYSMFVQLIYFVGEFIPGSLQFSCDILRLFLFNISIIQSALGIHAAKQSFKPGPTATDWLNQLPFLFRTAIQKLFKPILSLSRIHKVTFLTLFIRLCFFIFNTHYQFLYNSSVIV